MDRYKHHGTKAVKQEKVSIYWMNE
jgi:hypothetical protein